MIITSTNKEHIKEINKLKEKKHRDFTKTFLIEGEHLVYEAQKKGLIKEIILLEGTDIQYNDVKTTYVSKEVMKKISNMESYPNIIGVCYKKENQKIGNQILILEDIQDPGNLGTIIRSSVAFGIDTIILSEKTVDLYNPKVLRSTQGMIFNINILVDDIEEILNKLKKENYKIYGTKVENGKNIKELPKEDKYALIIGNEGNGMSENTSKLCDECLYIKMNNSVESLNAAVAASILLYELSNK